MDRKTCIVLILPVVCIFGITAQLQCPYERDKAAAGRVCPKACQPDGSCKKQNRECQCDGLCGPVCLKKCKQCLRNYQEVQHQNRKCKRRCESDSDCLHRRRCVCDDICGLSCIPIDRKRYCEALSSDESVRVRIIPSNRTFGSIAQYECRMRYKSTGGSNERRCLGSGQWSGDPLTCIIKAPACPTLKKPRNGNMVINSSDRSIGAEVTYSCYDGYVLSGQKNRICQENMRWSGTRPSCRWPAKGVPCLKVPEEKGRIIFYSDNSENTKQHNSGLAVICSRRLVCLGQDTSTCLNGTWFPPVGHCKKNRNSECGISGNTVSRGRIVGGNDANPGAWPWQVYLDIRTGVQQLTCGGVLIDPYWVLTAAHCLPNLPDYRIMAVLGMTNLNEPRHQEIEVEEAIPFPGYGFNRNPLTFQNDIALLKLSRAAELNEIVRTVCLPDKTRAYRLIPRDPSGIHTAIITGWGHTEVRGVSDITPRQSSNQLQQLALPLKSWEECYYSLVGDPELNFFDESMFCAGYDHQLLGACFGDAGGPLVKKALLNRQRHWTVIGLASWGRGCAVPGELDFFTNVPYFMDWIAETMKYHDYSYF